MTDAAPPRRLRIQYSGLVRTSPVVEDGTDKAADAPLGAGPVAFARGATMHTYFVPSASGAIVLLESKHAL